MPAAPGSPSRSRRPLHRADRAAARCSRSASTRRSRCTPTSPATRSRRPVGLSRRRRTDPLPALRPRLGAPSIAEHDACGSAIRVDYRRGQVMRRLAGTTEVNEEWITTRTGSRSPTNGARPVDPPLVRDLDGRRLGAGVRHPGRRPSTSRVRGLQAAMHPAIDPDAPEAARPPARAAGWVCSPGAGSRWRTRTHTRSSPARCSAPTTSTSAPAAQPRGSRVPGPHRGRHRAGRHLRRPGAGRPGAAGRLRAGGGGRGDLPAAAQGGAQARSPGLGSGSVPEQRQPQARRHPDRHRPGSRGECAGRAAGRSRAGPGSVILVGERPPWPRHPDRGPAAGRAHRCPARLGASSRRRPWSGRGRSACPTCCPVGVRRTTRRPAWTRRWPGESHGPADRTGSRRRRDAAGCRRRRARRTDRGRRRSERSARSRCRAGGAGEGRLRGQHRGSRDRRDGAGRRGAAHLADRGAARHLRQLGRAPTAASTPSSPSRAR